MDSSSREKRIQERVILFRITLIAIFGILLTTGVGLFLLRHKTDQSERRQELVEEMYARISEDPRETFLVDSDAYPVEGEDDDISLDIEQKGLSERFDPDVPSMSSLDGVMASDDVPISEEHHKNERYSTLPLIDLEQMTDEPSSGTASNGREEPAGTAEEGKYVLTSCGTIQIPSISCSLPVWEGAGKIEMRYGAGHMPCSVLPGMNGNCVIYGHRMRAYGSMFNRLGEVKKGDVISLSSEERSYAYIVDQIEVIAPSLLSSYINAEDEVPRVTLITCTPTGVATHRLIVIGHLQS